MSQEFHFAPERKIPGWPTNEEAAKADSTNYRFAPSRSIPGLWDDDDTSSKPVSPLQRMIDAMKKDTTPFHFAGDPVPPPAESGKFVFAKTRKASFPGLWDDDDTSDPGEFHFAKTPSPDFAGLDSAPPAGTLTKAAARPSSNDEEYSGVAIVAVHKSACGHPEHHLACGGSCCSCRETEAQGRFAVGDKVRWGTHGVWEILDLDVAKGALIRSRHGLECRVSMSGDEFQLAA